MLRLFRFWTVRFLLFAVLSALVLVPRLSIIAAVLWSIGLGAAMAIATGTLRSAALSRRDRRLLHSADSVTTPRDGQVLAVCGSIEAEGETLRSPLRGLPCVAYLYTAYHRVIQPGGSSMNVFDYTGFGIVPASVRGRNFSARLGTFPHLHEFENREISSVDAPESVPGAVQHTRTASFEPIDGETIEYVQLMAPDSDWRGTTSHEKHFRREEGFDASQCIFREEIVRPGESVCAVGRWSALDRMLIATPDQQLWLYAGTPDKVRETLKASGGCITLVAWALIAGSIGTVIYLVM